MTNKSIESSADMPNDVDALDAQVKSELPKGVKVTNNHHQPMNICGVVIPNGETVEVSDFDPSSPLVAAWLNAKVISADDA